MTVAITVSAILALMILWDYMEKHNKSFSRHTSQVPDAGQHQLLFNGNPYHDPYYNRGPVFSPDRRHIWDGEKWVENESHMGLGIIIGALIVLAIVYIL